MSSWSIHLAQQIRAARHEKGYTQADLAKMARLHRNTISRIERGENVGVEDVQKAIAPLGLRLRAVPFIRPTIDTMQDYLRSFGDEDEEDL